MIHSGLAVQPNHENATPVDAVFGLAESSSSANNNEGGPPPVRRTITMVSDTHQIRERARDFLLCCVYVLTLPTISTLVPRWIHCR